MLNDYHGMNSMRRIAVFEGNIYLLYVSDIIVNCMLLVSGRGIGKPITFDGINMMYMISLPFQSVLFKTGVKGKKVSSLCEGRNLHQVIKVGQWKVKSPFSAGVIEFSPFNQ